MKQGIGSGSGTPPVVTRNHGREGADARRDGNTHPASARLQGDDVGGGRRDRDADTVGAPAGELAGLLLRRVRGHAPGRPQLAGAAGAGFAVGHLAGVAGGRGPSRLLSPLWGPDRADPWLAGKARYTGRFEAAVARDCEQAAVSRVATSWGLPPETVRRSTSGRCAGGRPASPGSPCAIWAWTSSTGARRQVPHRGLGPGGGRTDLAGPRTQAGDAGPLLRRDLPPAPPPGGQGRVRGHVGALSARACASICPTPRSSSTSST